MQINLLDIISENNSNQENNLFYLKWLNKMSVAIAEMVREKLTNKGDSAKQDVQIAHHFIQQIMKSENEHFRKTMQFYS
jgi:hypothetical protein